MLPMKAPKPDSKDWRICWREMISSAVTAPTKGPISNPQPGRMMTPRMSPMRLPQMPDFVLPNL